MSYESLLTLMPIMNTFASAISIVYGTLTEEMAFPSMSSFSSPLSTLRHTLPFPNVNCVPWQKNGRIIAKRSENAPKTVWQLNLSRQFWCILS